LSELCLEYTHEDIPQFAKVKCNNYNIVNLILSIAITKTIAMSGKRYKMYVTNVQNTCNDIGWHIKSGTYMLCADRTIGEFPK